VSIGEVLANARRRAGLSVAQVSHQTRIGETIIAGIEGDDYSACGGDFCARGHIRSIAAAVGADPEPLIEQYDSARLGPRALTDEVTEPLAAVRTSQHRRPEPVTPAGVHHRRPPAGPVTPTGRRQRRRRAPGWAVALGVALVAGLGFAGVPGRAGACVVNDQTGPAVDPTALFATICQKYVVLLFSAGVAYDADDWAIDTAGGGLLVPNLTS